MACARLIKGRRAADIGTDHGYLPCYLVEKGICDSALACDVAVKPLESAKAHIAKSGLGGSITAILSDGLKSVPLDGVSDIVIAGMGGELIAQILLARAGELGGINIILQPMTKWDCLRSRLYENGFEVTEETACHEGRFVYSVMAGQFTGKKPPYGCDLRYLYCGRVSADSEDGREYLLRQAMRLETAGRGKQNSPKADEAAQGRQMLELSKKIRGELE